MCVCVVMIRPSESTSWWWAARSPLAMLIIIHLWRWTVRFPGWKKVLLINAMFTMAGEFYVASLFQNVCLARACLCEFFFALLPSPESFVFLISIFMKGFRFLNKTRLLYMNNATHTTVLLPQLQDFTLVNILFLKTQIISSLNPLPMSLSEQTAKLEPPWGDWMCLHWRQCNEFRCINLSTYAPRCFGQHPE